MIYKEESERGKTLAELLYNSFSGGGILGKNDMPEDYLPKGVTKGSLEHLLFITLTVTIDYQRDANTVWANSRKTFEDPETRYLFIPKLLYETEYDNVVKDMRRHGLSKKFLRDAKLWRTVGISFYRKWGGNPINFLEYCGWDSLRILEHLKNDSHLEDGKYVPDFPNLRGDKIGPLWVRMLRDNLEITRLNNLEKVPIPVDIHIARATLATGILRGQYEGKLGFLFKYIRLAWFVSVKGLKIKNRPMIALDIDEPLWHLSKYGCSKNRNKDTGNCTLINECEAKDFCIRGKIKIENHNVEMET